jgi:chromate transporter
MALSSTSTRIIPTCITATSTLKVMSTALTLQPPIRAPLRAIAKAFLTVSVFGFGGGIVWARRIAVEQRGWLNDTEFLDIVSLCQFLPGPNIIGIAVCTGTKLRGAPGALAAIAGFLVLPWSVGLALGVLCLRYAQAPLLRHVLGGVSASAAGLLIATGLRLLLPHRRRPLTIGLAGLAVVLMAFSRLPLPLVLVALLPLSIALAAALR